MASKMFLDLVGPAGPVLGSCTDKEFLGKIEVDAFSFTGPTFTGDKSGSAGDRSRTPGAEKANDQTAFAFTVVKRLDLSSPELLQLFSKHQSAQPQPFPRATLTLRPVRGYFLLVLNLTDLYLMNYEFLPLYQDQDYPTENLSFSFRTCQMLYTPTPAGTGAVSPALTAGWNIKTMQMLK